MIKQASARHCFICGVENPGGLHIKFYQPNPGEVTAECTVPEQFQGYPGIVHGGIVSAMLDEVAGRVFISGDPPRFMVTVRLSVRFRKPVPVGAPLQLTGHAVEDKGRVATSRGEIRDVAGVLLAEAEVVMANMPEGAMAGMEWDERDWKVYPDEEEGHDR